MSDFSQTTLERVARAIYSAAFENHHGGQKPEPGWCWEKAGTGQQKFATKQARAALEALMEVGDDVRRAGDRAMYTDYVGARADPLRVWQAMLHHIMNEETGE